MISWPRVLIAKPLGQSLDAFPNVPRWRDLIKSSPVVQCGVDLGKDMRRTGQHTEEARKILFGQTARSLGNQAGAQQ
jgi:GST-like protein